MIRDHALQRVLATPAVTALTGPRVFTRRGPFGGLSLDETPGAFDTDGDLKPSIVLVEEARVAAEPTKQGPPRALTAVHILAAYCYERGYDYGGYDRIDRMLAGLKTALHLHAGGPLPSGVVWIESRWTSDGPDQVDTSETIRACVRVARFDITTTEAGA